MVDTAEIKNSPSPVDISSSLENTNTTLEMSEEAKNTIFSKLDKVNNSLQEEMGPMAPEWLEECKIFLTENQEAFFLVKSILDAGKWAELDNFIFDKWFIIDEISIAKLKREFKEVFKKKNKLEENTEENLDIDLDIEKEKIKIVTVLTKNIDKYKWEDKVVIEELIKNLGEWTIEELVEYFSNEEKLQKILEVIMNNIDAETYNTVCGLFDSVPKISPVLHQVLENIGAPKWPATEDDLRTRAMKPLEWSNMVTATYTEQVIDANFHWQDYKKQWNKIICWKVTLDLTDFSRSLKLSDDHDGYIKTEKVDYESDYKYRLEKVRIKKEAQELTAEKQSAQWEIDKLQPVIWELKEKIKELKDDLKFNRDEFLVRKEWKKDLRKYEKELEKTLEVEESLKSRISNIDIAIQALIQRWKDLDKKESMRKQNYLDKVAVADEKASEKFKLMERFWILTLQPILLRIQWELNRVRWNLDLWEGRELISNLDFERWDFWIKPNRYDVLMTLLNVVISWTKDKPMDVNLADDIAKWVSSARMYSEEKTIRAMLIEHWMEPREKAVTNALIHLEQNDKDYKKRALNTKEVKKWNNSSSETQSNSSNKKELINN